MDSKAATKIRTGTVTRESLRAIVALLDSTHKKAKAVLDAMELSNFDGELSFNGGNVGDNYAGMIHRWSGALETCYIAESMKPQEKRKSAKKK